jgi:hypothetical protein
MFEISYFILFVKFGRIDRSGPFPEDDKRAFRLVRLLKFARSEVLGGYHYEDRPLRFYGLTGVNK